MSLKVQQTFLLVASMVLAAGVAAPAAQRSQETVDKQAYDVIIERNPFGLKDPPPPKPKKPDPPEPPPKPDIKLTGLTSLLTPKQAYLMTKDDKGNTEYYALTEGQEKDGLEVLEINEKDQSVRIRNSGTTTLLTFATHGVEPPRGGGKSVAKSRSKSRSKSANASNNRNRRNQLRVIRNSDNDNRSTSAVKRTARPVRVRPDSAGRRARALGSTQSGSSNSRSQDDPQEPKQPDISAEEQVIMMELQKASNPDIPFPPIPGSPNNPPPQPPNGNQQQQLDPENPRQGRFPPQAPVPQPPSPRR